MKIHIVRLNGGLGNQLFQYAVLRACSQNMISKLYFDTEFLKRNKEDTDTFTSRNYELSIFKGIVAKPLTPFFRYFLLHKNIATNVLVKLLFGNIKHYCYEGIAFKRIDFNSSFYLQGYFQSEKYFKNIRTELLKELVFPYQTAGLQNEITAIKKMKHSVAIHVRRGDYLKTCVQDVHGVLSISYYEEATALILKHFEDAFFYIFSDDVDWCIENFTFLGSRYKVLKGNTGTNAWKDMFLMSVCKHHIIANSSFSWWGAWLSEQTDSIKIAPKNWFNPLKVSFTLEDIVPENWITL